MGRRAHTADNANEWFWPNVDKSGECWLWTAGTTRDGYGTVKFKFRATTTHHVAWELTNGPIPAGLWVLHDCPGGDNKICVRPDHMFLGTSSDNQKDRWKKFRADPSNDHALYVDPKGVTRYSRVALGWRLTDAWRNRQQAKEPAAVYAVGA